jgi:hypothetical protein
MYSALVARRRQPSLQSIRCLREEVVQHQEAKCESDSMLSWVELPYEA